MASEDLFEHEFSEEQDLELQQAMETEAEEAEEDKESSEVIEETPGNLEESATKAVADKPLTNGTKPAADHEARLTQLPLARIRNIMKLDPDLHMANNEAVFTVAKAVELFIASLSRESYTYTAQAKKKTIQKRDVEMAISAVDSLMFLDGAMNF
ncbi:DNA polymerase epsilon subunit 4 [Drosophila biarmipes]|uniref:DNA polymerase epsilon subunit 4 n=1 Tax=Drosophila biarmipes TaxID=125945 RepID=UPI0007E7FAC5|nr:DNA polymerase epsilon subunit 4 [Drosophila biarmipes]